MMSKFVFAEVSRAEIVRKRRAPFFQFIEDAVCCGRSFIFGTDGYLIVGGKDSLMDGFIVELYLGSNLPFTHAEDFILSTRELSAQGIWFDSSDYHAFDLIWRSGRTCRPSSILFSCPPSFNLLNLGEAIRIGVIEDRDLSCVAELFGSMPLDFGGRGRMAVEHMYQRGLIIGGFIRGVLIGAAIVQHQPDGWVAVDAVVVCPDKRRGGMGVRLMNALLVHFMTAGHRVSGGVGVSNLFAYRSLLRLGLRPERQSWVSIF